MHPIKKHYGPLKVAEDTYLIRDVEGEGQGPDAIFLNSLVINGQQPILVDTGTPQNRDQWFKDVTSIVDPRDVKWIYISHDDVDHMGNLQFILDQCPNATLIANWFLVERQGGPSEFPIQRMRWIDDGGSFDAGDRIIGAVRPPIYDSPTTRGLYDSKTGLYWASDAYATPIPYGVDNVAELDLNYYREGFSLLQRAISPWHEMLDERKFHKAAAKVEALNPTVIVNAHSPVITGDNIERVFTWMRQIPSLPAAELPGQEVLDMMVQAMNNGLPVYPQDEGQLAA